MKKPRLPFDIDFLLESILDESPDKIDLSGDSPDKTKESDAERLKTLGADVPVRGYSFKWLADDAYCFFFDVQNGVVLYARKTTHTDMQDMLRTASNKATGFPSTFKNMYNVSRDSFGNLAAYSYKEKQIFENELVTVGFVGLTQKGNDEETVRNYLHTNRMNFNQLDIRGGSGDKATVPAGRIWIQKNAVSFWNSKDEIVNENFQLVEKLMSSMKLNKTKFAYEFLDHNGLFAYSELTGNTNKEKLSPEEMKKLLAVQHLDSKAKRKLAGPTYKAAHLKKGAKGFDYAAKADAAIPALEGHIKLKDLLKEDPDTVYNQGEMKIAQWHDGDAVAFILTKKCSIVNKGGVHYDIIDAMQELYEELKDGSIKDDNRLAKELLSSGMQTDNIAGFRELLTHPSPLHNYIKNGGRHGEKNEDIYFRAIEGTIFGRSWHRKKIISFWTPTSYVVKHWDWVKKFFNNMSNITGNLNDYRVDWIERSDNPSGSELTSASDVANDTGKPDTNQQDFIAKLFGDVEKIKSLPPEEIKKLNKKIHTLPPDKKREALLAMGVKNTKAIEIADALGMTVAEFNNIMNVNESENN